jgi:hypothetical protein
LAFYGVDWDAPAPSALWDGDPHDDAVPVEVPALPDLLDPEDFHRLVTEVNPLHESEDSGVDLYINTLNFICACTE